MNYRLIIFDLDGTLLDTIGDLAAACNHVLRKHGLPEHDCNAYRYFVGNGITRLIERALPPEAREASYVAWLRREFVDYYQHNLSRNTKPYEGIPRMLAELRDKGFQLAVASNKYQLGTTTLIEHFFPDIPFAAILGQREKVPAKPSPSIVMSILERTGVDKAHTLFIGDSSVDMETAANAGVFSIGVTWGFRQREELERHGACLIAEHPEEITAFVAGMKRQPPLACSSGRVNC